MRQVWLRPNRRVLYLGMLVPALLVLVGSTLALALFAGGLSTPLRWLGVALAAFGALALLGLLYLVRTPRLAYENGQLLVYLRSAGPIRVPIQIVECFFLGQAESMLATRQGQGTETATVVVRLAESAVEWKHLQVKPSLGRWCDGYIVIRGTWCEPLTGDVVKQLNEQLIAAHRHQRQREMETA